MLEDDIQELQKPILLNWKISDEDRTTIFRLMDSAQRVITALEDRSKALKFYADKRHILYLDRLTTGKHVHLEVESGFKAREAMRDG